MKLGQRLRELRLAAGMSQMQLAKITGVTRNAVSQWEAGETQPTTKRLMMLSRALNVPVDHIIAPPAEVRSRIVEHATRSFERLGVEKTSIEMICDAAKVSRSDFDSLFESKDALLFFVARTLNDRCLEGLRNAPPSYGNLVTRLKYLLRHYYACDLRHPKIVQALHSYSWRWSEAQERENSRNLLEFHDTIRALFDDAAAQGEIHTGNYRAASGLIYAAYQSGLRKAILEGHDSDLLVRLIEPQLAIILSGFGFQVVPGFAESDGDT